MSVNLRRYLDVLRTPGVARLAAFTLVGQLPFAIVGLSIVLLMRREGYGYGDIGVVLAAESVAIALTAAPLGRLADRIGRSQVILVLGVATALMLTAETVAMLLKAPVVVLAAAAALQGAAIPPISASMRSLWGTLVPAERVESAYAFDAVQLELVFVVGPLIAAGIATVSTPAVGMFLCAGFYLVAAHRLRDGPGCAAAVPDVEV